MNDFVDRVGQYCKQGEESCNCAGVEAPCTFGCHETDYGVGGHERFENPTQIIRTFDSGATRDTDEGKLDYEGFLSPLVLRRYAEYMHKHRYQADGALRASDNWQRGIPKVAYMKSGWRHFFDWWTLHRSTDTPLEEIEEALCAVIFNASGYLHELISNE